MVADRPSVLSARPVPLVLNEPGQLRKELDAARAAGATVGFVPTMGALHQGHASLVRRAVAETDLTVVSVFVNPLQFPEEEDLERYPRRIEADVHVASEAGARLVFVPAVGDLWPAGPPATTVSVGPLGRVLEGASRPGHFEGVATVVTTLFNLVGPARAYFGEKDFQQLVVVGRLVADLALPVEVVACPTVREPDGLACSSRNAHLCPAERSAASVLYRSLAAAARSAGGGERRVSALRGTLTAAVSAEPLVELDYAEVVDPVTLAPLDELVSGARLVVAARIGSTRLIDNLDLTRDLAGWA